MNNSAENIIPTLTIGTTLIILIRICSHKTPDPADGTTQPLV